MKKSTQWILGITLALLFNGESWAQARRGYDPFPEIRLSQPHFKGEAALQALGLHQRTVANHYGLQVSELRQLLRRDPSTRISERGLFFYEESVPDTTSIESAIGDAVLGTNPVAASIPESETFRLNSRPGARGTIYLNYKGRLVTNSTWAYNGPIDAKPYSRDEDPAFSSQELLDIREHWVSIAEDYAAFDINVTTEEPQQYTLNAFIEIIMTPTYEWYGRAGGVCYVNSFTWGYGVGAQVCWVFSSLLGNNVKNVREAASHEAGHALNLYHWSQYDPATGNQLASYYGGAGTWAPIMGVGYYRPTVTWSRGEYYGAGTYGITGTQDDIRIINQTVGSQLSDDAPGNLSSSATLRGTTQNGFFQADHRGIIQNSSDTDVYRIRMSAGDLSLVVAPSAGSPNLDFKVRVVGAGNQVLFEGNPDGVSSVAVQLPALAAGDYALELSPVGFGDPLVDGYTSYGSNGMYQVVGSYPAGSVPDPTPSPTPTPSPSPTPGPGDAPQTQIVSPVEGTLVTARQSFSIVADGKDNTRLTRLRILVNGKQLCAKKLNVASYTLTCSTSTRLPSGSELRLVSEATDQSGLVTTSAPVTVRVR